MKITNRELHAAIEPLTMLGAISFPTATSLQIVQLTRAVNGPISDMETVRVQLVERLGEKNGEGVKEIVFPGDAQGRDPSKNWGEFSAEFEVLLGQEIDLAFERVELPTTLNGESFDIAPTVLVALEPFITIGG